MRNRIEGAVIGIRVHSGLRALVVIAGDTPQIELLNRRRYRPKIRGELLPVLPFSDLLRVNQLQFALAPRPAGHCEVFFDYEGRSVASAVFESKKHH